mmetsp:Transcript_28638/g.51172  ORF Transcript_28638/g.51172 Transcript_28638/m.51172 type:complete len:254 (+) Transcript_28638:1866-2627(+)
MRFLCAGPSSACSPTLVLDWTVRPSGRERLTACGLAGRKPSGRPALTVVAEGSWLKEECSLMVCELRSLWLVEGPDLAQGSAVVIRVAGGHFWTGGGGRGPRSRRVRYSSRSDRGGPFDAGGLNLSRDIPVVVEVLPFCADILLVVVTSRRVSESASLYCGIFFVLVEIADRPGPERLGRPDSPDIPPALMDCDPDLVLVDLPCFALGALICCCCRRAISYCHLASAFRLLAASHAARSSSVVPPLGAGVGTG